MYKRILAVGDIHGEYDKLLNLYDKIQFNPPDDLLVFLGDYVDRGPKPVHVLGWMLKRRSEPNIVMLRGNHDQMMLDHHVRKEVQKRLGFHVPDDDYGEDWLYNGGDATDRALRQFAARLAARRGLPAQRIMENCMNFIGGLPLSHRVEVGGRTFFFCHAGIRPGVPLDEQIPDDQLWIREEFIFHYTGSPMVVAGHTPVGGVRRALGMAPELEPVIQDNMILVDTAACDGGPLSCVDVLSGRVWQSG